MKRGKFAKPDYKEYMAKMAQKREMALKATKIAKAPKNAGKVAKQAKKRKKKTERQLLEEKIWRECKRIIRARHGDICYTCGAYGLEGSNWQTGHGKPKGALPIRFQYDLRNLRPQCMRDNIHLGGLSDIFVAKLEHEEQGLKFLNEACIKTEEGWRIRKDQTMGGKDATIFLRALLEEYKNTNC